MSETEMPELLPCPNPWCDKPGKMLITWDLYSRRVVCPCGIKGPRSESKANVTQGVPINGEAGVGYRLERAAVLPPLTFNSEEIEALVLGARMADAWADPALAVAEIGFAVDGEHVSDGLASGLFDGLIRINEAHAQDLC